MSDQSKSTESTVQNKSAPLQGRDKREMPRVSVSMLIHGEGGAALPLMFSRDISAGGIAVETSDHLPEDGPLQEGTVVNMSFALPFGDQFVRVDGEVAWIRRNIESFQGNLVTVIGFAFVNPDPAIINEIRGYFERTASGAAPPTDPDQDSIEATHEQNLAQPQAAMPEQQPTGQPLPNQPVEFFLEHALSTEDSDSTIVDMAQRAFRSLAPNEQKVLRQELGSSPTFQIVAGYIVKFDAQTNYLKWCAEQQSLPSSEDVATLVESDRNLITGLGDDVRAQVGELYAANNTTDGQLLTNLINKAEDSFKQFEKTTANLGVAAAPAKVQVDVRPLKEYYNDINNAIRQVPSGDNAEEMQVNVGPHMLHPWEIRAFLAGDDYWQREERAIVAGVVALAVKFKDEAATFQQLYNEDQHILEEIQILHGKAQQLVGKVSAKVQPLVRKLATEQHSDKQVKLAKSLTEVKNGLGAIEGLVNACRDNLATVAGTASPEKLYEGGKPKEQAPTPKEEKGKAKKSSGKGGRIAVLIFAALFTAYMVYANLPFILSMAAPKAYSNANYSKFVPIKSMQSWNNWVFIEVEPDKWNAIPPDKRQTDIEALYQQVKADKFKFLEIRDTNGKLRATTIQRRKKPRKLELRVY